MNKSLVISLGLIQTFVALGAIPGGLSMIIDPSGQGIGISNDILNDTPFENFLIPGLFLFIVNGLLHVAGCVLCFKRSRQAGIIGVSLGFLLLLWIMVQVYFVGWIHFLQGLFLAVGIVEMILGYLVILKSIKQPKILS